MTSQELKILCLTQSGQLPVLIKSVYGAIPHQLVVVNAFDKLYRQQQQQTFNLFVLDNETGQALSKDIQKIRLTNPKLYIIIIEDNYDNMEKFVQIPDIFFISRQEMLSKLPLILGEAYSGIKNRTFKSFDYFSLLKSSFDSLRIFIAIINDDGQFIFLNKAAQEILNITEVDYPTFLIHDLIIEGDSVWKYMSEQCLLEKKSIEGYKVNFRNTQDEILSKLVVIEPIILDKTYLLIQETSANGENEAICADKEYELLNKFADSIANELLNPVNVFSGRLQMLSSSGLGEDESTRKNIVILKKQVERINELMEKLLTFARLKQDAIPQKINFNELLNRVLLTPSLEPWLKNENFSLEFDLDPEPPIISGIIAQFDLLMKLILDRSFDCLGSEGKIRLKTTLKNKWLTVNIELFYSRSIFGDDSSLSSYLAKDEPGKHYNTIEATIIRHLIHRYNGRYSITQENQNTEKLELVIPVTNSK